MGAFAGDSIEQAIGKARQPDVAQVLIPTRSTECVDKCLLQD
ncbi:hypothetical protein [Spirosoma pulveris]